MERESVPGLNRTGSPLMPWTPLPRSVESYVFVTWDVSRDCKQIVKKSAVESTDTREVAQPLLGVLLLLPQEHIDVALLP